jgi:hypothetical protein
MESQLTCYEKTLTYTLHVSTRKGASGALNSGTLDGVTMSTMFSFCRVQVVVSMKDWSW